MSVICDYIAIVKCHHQDFQIPKISNLHIIDAMWIFEVDGLVDCKSFRRNWKVEYKVRGARYRISHVLRNRHLNLAI